MVRRPVGWSVAISETTPRCLYDFKRPGNRKQRETASVVWKNHSVLLSLKHSILKKSDRINWQGKRSLDLTVRRRVTHGPAYHVRHCVTHYVRHCVRMNRSEIPKFIAYRRLRLHLRVSVCVSVCMCVLTVSSRL